MVVCALLLHFTSPEHRAWKFKSPAWGFPCLWLTRHKSREERRESCVFPSDYFKLEIQEKTKRHPAQADRWGRSPCYVARTQGHLWSVRNLYHLQSLRGPRWHWLTGSELLLPMVRGLPHVASLVPFLQPPRELNNRLLVGRDTIYGQVWAFLLSCSHLVECQTPVPGGSKGHSCRPGPSDSGCKPWEVSSFPLP